MLIKPWLLHLLNFFFEMKFIIICFLFASVVLSTIPYVVQINSKGVARLVDIFTRLLQDRIICLNGNIDNGVSSTIVSQLLLLNSKNSSAPITLLINSSGGAFRSTIAIYDTIQSISSPVTTFCIGNCYSMGSLLLAAGTPGYRYSFPNSRMMIEQPKATFSANSEDMNIKNKELMWSRQIMHEIYSKHSGKNISYIDEADKKDLYLGPQEALDFGLVDQVISSRKSLQ